MIYLLFPLNALGTALSNSFIKIYRKSIDDTNTKDNFYYILMIVVALLFFGSLSGFNLSVTPITLAFAFVYALISYLSVTFNMRALEHAELITVSVFSTSGAILWNSLWGILFFGENLTSNKVIGIIATLSAVLCPYFAEKKTNKKSSKGLIYCFIMFLLSGCGQLTVKFYSVAGGTSPQSVFCFYTNVILIPFILLIIRKNFSAKSFVSGISKISRKTVFILVAALLISQAVNFSGMFLIKNVEFIIYSLTEKSLGIIAAAIVSKLLFKEKITITKLVSIILLAVSVCISNI